MALYKEIRQESGVITSYHRILFVQITVNGHNSIAVLSYVDETARISEKTAIIAQPYKKTTTYETGYDPAMSIETAYEYLKSLPGFEGAGDI